MANFLSRLWTSADLETLTCRFVQLKSGICGLQSLKCWVSVSGWSWLHGKAGLVEESGYEIGSSLDAVLLV